MGGATEENPTGAKGGIDAVAMAPIGPVGDRLIPLEDDSGTIAGNPRTALIVALAVAVRDGAASGDDLLVRIAGRVLVELTDGPERVPASSPT